MPRRLTLSPSTATEGPAAKRRAPYTVERFPCPDGAILLVGYDARGGPLMELRVREANFTGHTVTAFRAMLMSHAANPFTVVRSNLS